MASLRRIQTLVRPSNYLFRPQQRRWAQVHDVRSLATHGDSQKILERYKHKLDQKAEQEGHDSVDSLKEAYKEKIAEYRRKASTVATPESLAASSNIAREASPSAPSKQTTAHSSKAAAEQAAANSQTPGIKPLSSYLNLEKILALPPKEIETLWRLRHANNARSICAAIPLDTYQRMAAAARSNPQFILPLPRHNNDAQADNSATVEGGADIHFLQWGFHPPAGTSGSSIEQTANTHTSTILFTHLAAYKIHGSYTQPHTTITHHLDLADSKGLVLMHGQVMPDSGVSVAEASWLVSCVQRFYDFDGEGHGRKGELLRMFTRGDVQGFKIEDLVSESETLS